LSCSTEHKKCTFLAKIVIFRIICRHRRKHLKSSVRLLVHKHQEGPTLKAVTSKR